ncbi:MAG: leucyl aminopeptidase [Acidimicrobiales bacterium]
MPITAELARTAPDDVEAIAVGAVEGRIGGHAVDWSFLAAQGFEAKRGDVRALPSGDGRTVFVVGLGKAEEVDGPVLRHAAGSLARAARRHASMAVDLLGHLVPGASVANGAQAIVEGLVLGGYEYAAFKTDLKPAKLSRVVVVGGGGARVRTALERGVAVAEAVCWVRDLVNEPGGSLTPTKLADQAVQAGESAGFEVTVWTEKEIRKERLGGLLGVNRGSTQSPRFLQLRYEPAAARATVALVGKGITFDSGGLSLKPADAMVGMKGDMGGAGAVLGAFRAVAAMEAKVRLLGFIPITDNMTGGDATRVGDVLTMRNGKTVEVLNTDAEGRLILADALVLASEAAPDAIVDLATLTGACIVALGDRTAGLMTNHQGWLDQVRAASGVAGEPTWPLPLPAYLRGKLDSDVADLKNITSARWGGALAAGIFLREFVGDGIPWTHIDIAGPADASEVDGEIVKGGTGFGVRTLVELVTAFSKPKRAEA